ncbi:hypothetical protein GH714_013046 [Hevea brasiliensis]|uniref:Retrotransposon Copia-like N-terminal domain-containing protein n=1 Tax=Hevea brasiliensis TaxID=3981 RepID=A0A6A6N146_HEVBR|nr:hypothetical protein GH714_013046 [Hevea brasiliensis]
MLKPLLNLPPPIISWYTQWRSLLIGYDFTSYVTSPPTAHQLVSDYWNRQDQLLGSAIIASLSSDIVQQESLANAQKGTQSMTSYLQNIKYLVTTLNFVGSTLTMDDITLHVLHGLPSEYNGTADALRIRDTSVSFDELYEKLVDYEAYLQRKSISVSSPVTVNAVTRTNNSSATRINKNP